MFTALDEARTMLRNAVAEVPATGWELATPCAEWNVTQVLQHAVLDQLVWAAALSGTAMPAENPFAPSGQLAVPPLTFTEESLAASAAAWTRVAASAPERVPTPLPQGELAPSVAAGAAALDAAIHAWDIWVACHGTGMGSPLTPDLARALRPVAESIVEPLREYGAYGAVVEVPAGAADDAALLAYLGRRPDWAA
jgi:uncharacterized protein (TIGR03086 family)